LFARGLGSGTCDRPPPLDRLLGFAAGVGRAALGGFSRPCRDLPSSGAPTSLLLSWAAGDWWGQFTPTMERRPVLRVYRFAGTSGELAQRDHRQSRYTPARRIEPALAPAEGREPTGEVAHGKGSGSPTCDSALGAVQTRDHAVGDPNPQRGRPTRAPPVISNKEGLAGGRVFFPSSAGTLKAINAILCPTRQLFIEPTADAHTGSLGNPYSIKQIICPRNHRFPPRVSCYLGL
jgi:hypothetical protein